MTRNVLLPKTELPDRKRPLDPDEVEYLEREALLYGRWRRFYSIARWPLTPVGVVAIIGALYSLMFGDALGVNSMQAFLVGMAVSVFGLAPLYLSISMRDKKRDIQEILDTYPRTDAVPLQDDESDQA